MSGIMLEVQARNTSETYNVFVMYVTSLWVDGITDQ